jgi:hypothetical protein
VARFGSVFVVCSLTACQSAPPSHRGSGAAQSASLASVGVPSAARSVPNVASAGIVPGAVAASSASRALALLGEPIASCNWVDIVSSCTEAVAPTAAERETAFRALNRLCKSVPQRTACPLERRVGSCRTADGFVDHYYSSGARPYTSDEAKAECENREGRWLG